MSLLDLLDQQFPRFAFARRVPPRQMFHRLWLQWRDRLRGMQFARLSSATVLKDQSLLPAPVFPPRTINVARASDGWSFTFLQRTVSTAADIDWQAPGAGPRDQLWRMNLHYFEYLEVLPAADGAALIDQWIIANPVTRPGALSDAWNSYALSLRLICWIHWLAVHGAMLPAAQRSVIEASMRQQLSFLETHLELDLGGNHLIKNIKALLIASAAFEGPDAARWRQMGLRLLRRELTRQILPDGVHFELSASYHCQVAADLIEACAILPADERAPFLAPIRAMVTAAHVLAHPDGYSAQFNDAGLTMAYRPADIAKAAQETGLIAAGPPIRHSLWLEDSGYLAWHDGDDSLIIKAKHIAPDALPAHGHADLGSIELSVGGRRCIVDQGVFEYVDGPQRWASRSAASHNVLQVGDLDQADFFGAFRIGWRAQALAQATIGHDNVAKLSISHRAFAPTCGMVQRTIEARRGSVVIGDRIEQATQLPIVTRLLLHPDWAARIEEGTICLSCQDMTLRIAVNGALMSLLPALWWPDMGRELPTTRLQFAWLPSVTASQLTISWDKRASQ